MRDRCKAALLVLPSMQVRKHVEIEVQLIAEELDEGGDVEKERRRIVGASDHSRCTRVRPYVVYCFEASSERTDELDPVNALVFCCLRFRVGSEKLLF